jgi:hypothetical protein
MSRGWTHHPGLVTWPSAVQLVKDIEDALEFLDNHFTFNKEDLGRLTQVRRKSVERLVCRPFLFRP